MNSMNSLNVSFEKQFIDVMLMNILVHHLIVEITIIKLIKDLI